MGPGYRAQFRIDANLDKLSGVVGGDEGSPEAEDRTQIDRTSCFYFAHPQMGGSTGTALVDSNDTSPLVQGEMEPPTTIQELAEAGERPARPKVPICRIGADCLVVAMKRSSVC